MESFSPDGNFVSMFLCFIVSFQTMPFHLSWLIPLVFYRLVWQNGKHCPLNRSRKQRGENKPITILVPSYEYGCVRPFRAGISLI